MPPENNPPAPMPVADFVRDLARSRVVTAARAGELFAEAPPPHKWESAGFADHLVRRGELTRFQADKLLRGHWRGLALGPYRVLCPLGRGGMGVVYLAKHPDAPGVVALKVLPPQRSEERMLARFRREMDIGRKLPPHPHLTRTLDSGEVLGVLYLAMEYVPGRTVRQMVTAEGPLPVGVAARLFADAAAGLHAAHSAGFVHRDLKPSNVMVTPAGRAKVLDFGFALIRGEEAPADPSVIGGPGYAVGTMDYLAPEQADDPTAVGPPADVYSLGCSLYFAVTGSPPFPGGTQQDKIRWQKSATAAPVGQLNPRVPPEFARLIEELMAKSPDERPVSAGAVALRLGAFADPIRPAADVATGTDELLKLAETTWKATAGVVELQPDESLVILDEPLPVARPTVPTVRPVARPVVGPARETVRVPYWVAAACLGALAAAVLLGCVLAQVLG